MRMKQVALLWDIFDSINYTKLHINYINFLALYNLFIQEYFAGSSQHLHNYQLPDSSTKVSWYKDGQRIISGKPSLSGRIRVVGQFSDQLQINSVRQEDVGLYQCFVVASKNLEFQAASELRLGGIPNLRMYIIEI